MHSRHVGCRPSHPRSENLQEIKDVDGRASPAMTSSGHTYQRRDASASARAADNRSARYGVARRTMTPQILGACSLGEPTEHREHERLALQIVFVGIACSLIDLVPGV